jgi:hypothetical protein
VSLSPVEQPKSLWQCVRLIPGKGRQTTDSHRETEWWQIWLFVLIYSRSTCPTARLTKSTLSSLEWKRHKDRIEVAYKLYITTVAFSMQLQYTTKTIKNYYNHGRTKVHYRVLKLPQLLRYWASSIQSPPLHHTPLKCVIIPLFNSQVFPEFTLFATCPVHFTIFRLMTNKMAIYYTLIVQFFPSACFSASCPSVFIK